MYLVLVLVCLIAFIVVATSHFKLSPFITLLVAAFLAAFAYDIPMGEIDGIIRSGFGNIMGSIGLVIVLGTLIGVILERTGAAIVMAESVVRVLGKRFPTLTVSAIGFFVSIPVFCDSGFVVLNSLKRSLSKTLHASPVAMSVALSTGLFATHTLVPPTPGPIAAAGNLGLADNLGLVIAVGFGLALVAAATGLVWANFMRDLPSRELELDEEISIEAEPVSAFSAWLAFAPILLPIALICLGSVANYPADLFGTGFLYELLNFLGKPLNALMLGLGAALVLLLRTGKAKAFGNFTQQGIVLAAPILLVTGAGGAFGAVLAATPIGVCHNQGVAM